MIGQWIGSFSGTNEGIAVLDLEAENAGYSGHAFIIENGNVPGLMAKVALPTPGDEHDVECAITPLTAGAGLIDAAAVASAYPGIVVPETARLKISRQDRQLSIRWETAIGTKGEAYLVLSEADLPSVLEPEITVDNWSSFKEYVWTLNPRQLVFRGQPDKRRLRTSFHRTDRKDLVRYVSLDVPIVRQAVLNHLTHLFRDNDASDNGAFWNLIQHHGYPTPLLDWSYSPFVAAYFAYRMFRRNDLYGDNVRIYAFDASSWFRDQGGSPGVTFAGPHLTILDTLPINNPRAMPQQAVSTMTNIDDIEGLIAAREKRAGTPYLRCFDLPFEERHTVLHDLALMGISAASLFPGLDGACEEVKGRLFGFNV